MQKLATLYRSAQFYAHNAHNTTTGCTFFQDHEFFGGAYAAYEEAYDGVVERMIGLGMAPDLLSITSNAAKAIQQYGKAKDTDECFKSLLELEQNICSQIKQVITKATEGTQNLLQGLADESEMRQYKIQQRIIEKSNEKE